MMQQKPRCTLCQSSTLLPCLSFGKQPPSNRFITPKSSKFSDEDRYLLSLGYCQMCGAIQLTDRMPIEAVRPRYDWLVYNEPEGHLDDVTKRLEGLPGISKSSRFLGVTYKDKSTLDRINSLGFKNSSCISENSLNCSEDLFGLETIQKALSEKSTIEQLRKKYGAADVLVIRHIVEHSSDANLLIRSLRGLLAPNGYMLLELPDSERIMNMGNHAFIWEEHISYFT